MELYLAKHRHQVTDMLERWPARPGHLGSLGAGGHVCLGKTVHSLCHPRRLFDSGGDRGSLPGAVRAAEPSLSAAGRRIEGLSYPGPGGYLQRSRGAGARCAYGYELSRA